MKFIIAVLILFFANVLMANECHTRALKAAQDADGTNGGNRGPASTSTSGRVEKGMKDPDGNSISDNQAAIANGRAAAIKAATGKDLTPQQATALLNDANAKQLLGDDYKYYLAEKPRPGGAALLKAEESAKTLAEAAELKRKAEAETRAIADAERKRIADAEKRKEQERLDAIARQKEKEALDRRQLAGQNPYNVDKPGDSPLFLSSPNNMTPTAARQNLTNHTSPGLPAAAQALSGLENVMASLGPKIANLKSAIAKSEAEDKVKKLSDDGVKTKSLKGYLNRALNECYGLSTVARSAGLTASSVTEKINDFTSVHCR